MFPCNWSDTFSRKIGVLWLTFLFCLHWWHRGKDKSKERSVCAGGFAARSLMLHIVNMKMNVPSVRRRKKVSPSSILVPFYPSRIKLLIFKYGYKPYVLRILKGFLNSCGNWVCHIHMLLLNSSEACWVFSINFVLKYWHFTLLLFQIVSVRVMRISGCRIWSIRYQCSLNNKSFSIKFKFL